MRILLSGLPTHPNTVKSGPPDFHVLLKFCALLLVVAWSFAAGDSFALGPNGSAIDSSDYTVDFHQGPILASSRIVGLAGSIAPLSEGVVGYPVNPASVAMRVPWSRDWFDWELDGSVTSPSSISNTDFDNNGDSSFANNAALFLTFGGGLQFGKYGLGVHADVSEYEVRSLADAGDAAEEGAALSASLAEVALVAGRVFFDGQLSTGMGLAIHEIELSLPEQTGDAPPLAAVAGGSLLVGVVASPLALPLRVGVSARIPTPEADAVPIGVSADENGDFVAAGYIFPHRITVPAEFHAAVAWQFFRPLNTPWVIPNRRRATHPATSQGVAPPLQEARPRRVRLLTSAALKVTLPSNNGVGVESFFRQVVERSGEHATFSPRFGAEVEPVPDLLVVRAGSYLEPTRFAASSSRWHGTAGLDLHLPISWSLFGLLDPDTTFRVGGAVDRASRYFGWSASVGVWH